MDDRREIQTTGESTFNTLTALHRPENEPAMSAFYSSQETPTKPEKSAKCMPSGSSASFPANEVKICISCYSTLCFALVILYFY